MKTPKYLKAAVLTEINKPLKILKKIEIPDLKKNQVLVKIFYAGLCHSQLMEIKGHRGKDKFLPHMLGHEGSGKVIKTGSNVKKVKEGDKVILGWIKGKGSESKGCKLLFGDKIINSGPITTFSTYSIISENRIIKMPKNLNYKQAVLFGCAIPTGMGLIFNKIRPKKNNKILIYGFGGVGLSSFVACKILGIKNITIIDSSEQKLRYAKKIGAKFTFNAMDPEIYEKINKITANELFDIVIESAGKKETIESSFALINKNTGKCYFASHPKKGKKIKIDPFELICGKQIFGTWGGETKPDRDIPFFVKKCNNKKINLNIFFNKTYNLDNINKAVKDLSKQKVLRPIIKMF